MTTPTRARIAIIGCLVFVGGVVLGVMASCAFGSTGPHTGTGTGSGTVDRPTDSFSISGDLSELVVPGSSVPLNLSISNGFESTMVVTQLKVSVASVTAPNATPLFPCTVADYSVRQVSKDFSVRIAAKSTSSLEALGLPNKSWPAAGMLDTPSNQDGCKGASLVLAYEASGRLDK